MKILSHQVEEHKKEFMAIIYPNCDGVNSVDLERYLLDRKKLFFNDT